MCTLSKVSGQKAAMRFSITKLIYLVFIFQFFLINGHSEDRATPTPSVEDGWIPLFNGKDLTGWNTLLQKQGLNKDPDKVFQVVDGTVHVYKDHKAGGSAPAGYIGSKKEYSNYHLWFEWKWGTKKFGGRTGKVRDAGLIYHYSGSDKVWPHGTEYQIQEGDCGDIWMVNGVWMECYTGAKEDGAIKKVGGGGTSRYKKSLTNEVDGWNYGEVILIRDSLVHVINGKVNNRCRKMQEKKDGQMQPMTRGKILFQAEWAEVQYRNILMLELNEKGEPLHPVIKGCTDQKACNYVDSATVDDGSCKFSNEETGTCDCPKAGGCPAGIRFAISVNGISTSPGFISINESGSHAIGLADLQGRLVFTLMGEGSAQYALPALAPGLYVLKIATPRKTLRKKIVLY